MGAVALCGELLLSLGSVQRPYVEAMWEREQLSSSYMGNFVAIPHGTNESRKFVNFGQLVFLRFSQPVIWDNNEVLMCIAIAAQGDEHVEILGNLADALLDEDKLGKLMTTQNKEDVINILAS